MSIMKLEELKWIDIEKYLKNDDRIILPIGSTEEHGKWLPLGTDTFAAVVLAEDASKKTGVLVAPPLFFGWSPHHMALPGTISIRAEILIELLYDIFYSLAKHGFKKFVCLNGHRIVNLSWIRIAAERAQRRLGVKVVIFDPAYMSKEIIDKLGFGKIGHAEEIEGSHILYKFPNLVDVESGVDYIPEERELYYEDLRDTRDTLCHIPSTESAVKKLSKISGGNTGKPSISSAKKGKMYHEHLLMRLIEVLNILNR